MAATTCRASCWRLASRRDSSVLLRCWVAACACTAMLAFSTSSVRNACASCRSRSPAVSDVPLSHGVIASSWRCHCRVVSCAMPWSCRRFKMSSACCAASAKRRASMRSSKMTDCRALRSITTLRSLSSCAASLSASALAALSRLSRVRSSSARSPRSDAAPSNTAISKNAITSSWRKENFCSMLKVPMPLPGCPASQRHHLAAQ